MQGPKKIIPQFRGLLGRTVFLLELNFFLQRNRVFRRLLLVGRVLFWPCLIFAASDRCVFLARKFLFCIINIAHFNTRKIISYYYFIKYYYFIIIIDLYYYYFIINLNYYYFIINYYYYFIRFFSVLEIF